MATYHVTVVPRPGEQPNANFCPLLPCDVTADSEAAALDQAETLICYSTEPLWECAYQNSGGDEEAAGRAVAFVAQWQPTVRQVDRPSVDVKPRALVSETKRDGIVVGTRYDYETPAGEQSFDVLIDGNVSGVLVGRVEDWSAHAFGSEELVATVEARRAQPGNRTWFFAEAKEPLACIADRRWDVPSNGAIVEYPNVVLADIRTALETKNGKHGE
jgi:hypothetical protein